MKYFYFKEKNNPLFNGLRTCFQFVRVLKDSGSLLLERQEKGKILYSNLEATPSVYMYNFAMLIVFTILLDTGISF